jgi:polysaccharide export outer membrane protein
LLLPAEPTDALPTTEAAPVSPDGFEPALPPADDAGAYDVRFALGPGDVLKVTVWGYPELSPEQLVILPDGTISYPLIGTLHARGLTAHGLSDAISQALTEHMESPQVSVVVTEMRSRHFSVMGEVRNAGVYPLWGGEVTLLEAVAQAGGMTPTAIPTGVRVFRQGAEPAEPITIDMTAILRGDAADPVMVHAGDVIHVPSQDLQKKVCVLGDVNVPGLYTVTPEMTVIDALSAAGWVKNSGVMSSVMLARKGQDGGHEFFRVDAKRAVEKQDWTQHLVLQPGDIIFVPKHFIAKVGDFTSFFTSKVEPAAHTYLRVYDAGNPANVVVNR